MKRSLTLTYARFAIKMATLASARVDMTVNAHEYRSRHEHAFRLHNLNIYEVDLISESKKNVKIRRPRASNNPTESCPFSYVVTKSP